MNDQSGRPPGAVPTWLQTALADGAFPQASAAWGDANGARRVCEVACNPGAVYDLASLTKVIATAMVALRLAETGKLDLDSGIGDHLRAPRDKASVPIMSILTHTAGFASHFRIDRELARLRVPPERSARLDAALEAILTRPLEYEPGTAVVYSCLGFITLGAILERAGGEPLNVLAERLVFKPLRMAETGFLPRPRIGPGRIAPTELDPDTGRHVHGEVHDENARYLTGVSGNAGLFAPLRDVVRFATMLVRGADGFLSPELFARATSDLTPHLDAGRGLGFAIDRPGGNSPGRNSVAGGALGPGTYGHTGFTGTSISVSPSRGIFAVLLTNRVHLGRDLDIHPDYRAEFHDAVALEAGAR